MNEVVWLDDVPDAERWKINDTRFRVGDVEYVATMRHRSTTDRLCIKKPPALVDATIEILEQFRHGNIVELGISQGGSSVLAAQIAEPVKLVALELAPDPVEPLETFIASTDRRATVRPYYGVDQADRTRVQQILDDEFADVSLDLVIDDASHLLAETRTSFEVLYPRLRPGGLYIIEDWNWEHLRAEAIVAKAAEPGSAANAAITARMIENAAHPDMQRVPETPLTTLAMELLLMRAWSGDVVAEVSAKDMWLCVRRGPAELDPDQFRVADYTHDRFGLLPRTTAAGE